VGRRCGSCWFGWSASLAGVRPRWGSGENGADSGKRSVTLMYRNALAVMGPSFGDVRTEKSDVLAIHKFTGMLSGFSHY
jgi:hypothetical protein